MFEPASAEPAEPPALAARTAVLAQAVEGVLEADASSVDDGDLAEAMVALRRQQSRLAAAVSGLTAAFDARRAWADDGSRNAADWLAVRCRLPRPQAATEVREARHPGGVAGRCPVTRACPHPHPAGRASPGRRALPRR